MSRRKQLRSFLELHPTCIFCGGAAPATTQDHVPSRQLFTDRWWPEEYVFPACARCNQSTRRAEQVVALLSRFGPGETNDNEDREFRSVLTAVQNNDPEILREMFPSRAQVADFHAKPWVSILIQTGAIAPMPLTVK